MGFVGTGFSPLLGALIFLLSLPVVLGGVWSFQTSAIALVTLFLLDLFTSSWPDISITSYVRSNMGATLLALTILNLLIWAVSPFTSISAFIRKVRDEY